MSAQRESQMVAYCWRNGRIHIGRAVPNGALPLAYGSRHHLRQAVIGRSRHHYNGKTYLVPGVPEAENDAAAEAAYVAFVGWLTKGDRPLTQASLG